MNDELNPETNPGIYNEQEEPLPKATTEEEKLAFIRDALTEASVQLTTAEVWALELRDELEPIEVYRDLGDAIRLVSRILTAKQLRDT